MTSRLFYMMITTKSRQHRTTLSVCLIQRTTRSLDAMFPRHIQLHIWEQNLPYLLLFSHWVMGPTVHPSAILSTLAFTSKLACVSCLISHRDLSSLLSHKHSFMSSEHLAYCMHIYYLSNQEVILGVEFELYLAMHTRNLLTALSIVNGAHPGEKKSIRLH